MATTAKEVTTTADEGNGGPAMEVRLCGGHISSSHDHGGLAMEVLWWPEKKRAERWKITFERWEITCERWERMWEERKVKIIIIIINE